MTTLIYNQQCAVTDDKTYMTEGFYTLKEENGIFYASLWLSFYNKTFTAEADSRDKVGKLIDEQVNEYMNSPQPEEDWCF